MWGSYSLWLRANAAADISLAIKPTLWWMCVVLTNDAWALAGV